MEPIYILLIEDNADHAELICDYLDDIYEGQARVECSDLLLPGLRKLNEGEFDILLTDLSLPDSKIEQTVNTLKSLDTETPIVVLTSLDDENVVKSLIHNGVQDFLVKEDLGSRLLYRVCNNSIERKQQQQQLKNALHEKELLLSEIHHRVKNNLQIIDSLLDLQLDQIRDNNAKDLIGDCQRRIRSMALIHQTLYQSKDFARVDLKLMIDSLVSNLRVSFSDRTHQLDIQLELDEVKLSLNTSIPLGLIVNEVCTNAFKHAYPPGDEGIVIIRLNSKQDGSYLLEICDFGIGIDSSVSLQDSKTLGLNLIQLLSQQLEGDLQIQRKNPTRFSLTFKELE